MENVRDLVEDRGYRLGGDEVTALLPRTPFDGAMRLAEAIRAAVEAAFRDDKVQATASIGVVTFVAKVSSDVASKAADEQMYVAKRAGGNRVAGVQWAPASPAG